MVSALEPDTTRAATDHGSHEPVGLHLPHPGQRRRTERSTRADQPGNDVGMRDHERHVRDESSTRMVLGDSPTGWHVDPCLGEQREGGTALGVHDANRDLLGALAPWLRWDPGAHGHRRLAVAKDGKRPRCAGREVLALLDAREEVQPPAAVGRQHLHELRHPVRILACELESLDCASWPRPIPAQRHAMPPNQRSRWANRKRSVMRLRIRLAWLKRSGNSRMTAVVTGIGAVMESTAARYQRGPRRSSSATVSSWLWSARWPIDERPSPSAKDLRPAVLAAIAPALRKRPTSMGPNPLRLT